MMPVSGPILPCGPHCDAHRLLIRIATLEAQLAEREADKERLDWLDESVRCVQNS